MIGQISICIQNQKSHISTHYEDRNNTQQQQPFYGPLSGTTRVSQYQKKHSPTHYPDHHPIFISFFHLPQSIASSLFKLHAWQSFRTTSFHVLFRLPLGLEPSTSYSIHFYKQMQKVENGPDRHTQRHSIYRARIALCSKKPLSLQ